MQQDMKLKCSIWISFLGRQTKFSEGITKSNDLIRLILILSESSSFPIVIFAFHKINILNDRRFRMANIAFCCTLSSSFIVIHFIHLHSPNGIRVSIKLSLFT